MSLYDTDKIRADYPVSEQVSRSGVALKADGKEFKGLCPFHNEKSPSFTVNDEKGFFHCFGCGAHGDVVDFVEDFCRVDFKEACRIITGSEPALAADRVGRESLAVDYYAGLTALPAPVRQTIEAGKQTPPLFNPKRADDEKKRFVRYTPSMVFAYHDAAGALLGYVLRVEFDDAKITPTVRWAKLKNGQTAWTHWHFDEPRPLYGLELLAKALPTAQVFICEGEKATEACRRLIGVTAVTWPGGTNAVAKADWSPLQGRKVVIWPDADEPGWKAAQEVAEKLQGIAAEVKIIDSRDAAKGWDAADAEAEGMTREQAIEWGKARISVWQKPEEISSRESKEIRDEPPPPKDDGRDYETVTEAKPRTQAKPNSEKPAASKKTKKASHLRVVPSSGTVADLWQNQIIPKEDGSPKAKSIENVMLVLEHHEACRGMLVHDVFADHVMLMRRPPWDQGKGKWTPRPIRDDDSTACAGWLERTEAGELSVSIPNAWHCMVRVAMKHQIDPPRDYLMSLKWDGTERLSSWLLDYAGVPEDAYTTTVARKWAISLVGRVLQPGLKADAMLNLEGPQGIGKSALLEVWGTWDGRNYYTDQLDNIENKDAVLQMQGRVLIEHAELDTLDKSSTNAIKKFLTRTIDRIRPPYGRTLVERPRRFIFAGTVNPGGNGYLKDPTGARRFWPVRVNKIDLDGLRKALPQLLAEAVVAFQAGEKNWIDEEEVLALSVEQQAERYEEDPWADTLDEFLRGLNRVTMLQLMQHLAIPIERRDKRASNRIAAHMRHLGWEYKKNYRDPAHSSPIRAFCKPEKEKETLL